MTKNPFFNALIAFMYIVVLVLTMVFGTKLVHPQSTIVAPIAVISLFTLSAAVMAYVFGYQSFQLYFDNKRDEAVTLFLQTVIVFAGLTIMVLLLLFTGLLRV